MTKNTYNTAQEETSEEFIHVISGLALSIGSRYSYRQNSEPGVAVAN